jgi:hypothetical protein
MSSIARVIFFVVDTVVRRCRSSRKLAGISRLRCQDWPR